MVRKKSCKGQEFRTSHVIRGLMTLPYGTLNAPFILDYPVNSTQVALNHIPGKKPQGPCVSSCAFLSATALT